MSSIKGHPSKKETTTMKVKTKHGPGARPSSRANTPKHSDDVSKEISHLTEQMRAMEGENRELKEKLRTLSIHLIDAGRQSGEEIDFDPNSDILDVPIVELMSVIAGFNNRSGQNVVVHKSKDLEENRLEELETRVTQLNTELAKLFKLKLKIENGLQEIDKCRDYEEVRKKAKYLWYESSGTKLFIDPKKADNSPVSSPVTTVPVPVPVPVPVRQPKTSNGFPPAVRVNLERVHIATPPGKLPADTHINDMHRALQQVIIQELSLYKCSGADWRMFAERVGIPSQLVTQWKTMKLPQPMKNVLYVWGESPGATVRMLHRHLTSPMMKCVILAKRLGDFYEVD